ncbi:hypothetical protein QUF63_01375 [Anaerolineales bacterium HSG25]|nr:hypothetical protein [Anaerolineales bacterium HSG25]
MTTKKPAMFHSEATGFGIEALKVLDCGLFVYNLVRVGQPPITNKRQIVVLGVAVSTTLVVMVLVVLVTTFAVTTIKLDI